MGFNAEVVRATSICPDDSTGKVGCRLAQLVGIKVCGKAFHVGYLNSLNRNLISPPPFP